MSSAWYPGAEDGRPWRLGKGRCQSGLPFRESGWFKFGVSRRPGQGRAARMRSPPCVQRRGRAPTPLRAPCLPPPPARPPGRPWSGRRRLSGASAPAIRLRRRRLAPKATTRRCAADKMRGGGAGRRGEGPGRLGPSASHPVALSRDGPLSSAALPKGHALPVSQSLDRASRL